MYPERYLRSNDNHLLAFAFKHKWISSKSPKKRAVTNTGSPSRGKFDMDGDCLLPRSTMTSPVQEVVEFVKFEINGEAVNVAIPLAEDVEPDEYVAQLFAEKKLDICLLDEARTKAKDLIYNETRRVEDEQDDELVKQALKSKDVEFHHIPYNPNKNKQTIKLDSFAHKFSQLMHSSSGHCLMTLMQTQNAMAKEMANLTRTRAWEVEALAKECDTILANMKEVDMHPYKLNQINEKLKQVHGSYSCQISALIDSQRRDYRQFVEKLYKNNGIATPPEQMSDFHMVSNSDCVEEKKPDIDESFTVYIGAQLKSMHNVRLISCDSFHQLCRPQPDAKLQTAMSLYGRTLSGLIMFVRKHPSHHIMDRTNFAQLCEQTTELHFDTLATQLEKASKLAYEANEWRENNKKEDELNESGTCEKPEIVEVAPEAGTDCLNVGDIYCTKHSNLSQQIVFHIVGDDDLATTDISSRHPVLNAIRNVIRTADRISLTHLYIPLLLIERPSEQTTTAWCIRRAEMVYKCVKGYLMEVCGAFCGGSPNETPHYNVNFVVPNGLSATIYHNLSNMLPTIFHLVPGVGTDVKTTYR